MWRHNLGNKQLQYTYCPVSQEVKPIRQWKLVSLQNIVLKYIFLKKSYTKCGAETIPRPFSKNQDLDQLYKVLYSLYLLFTKLKATKYIETKLQTTCYFHGAIIRTGIKCMKIPCYMRDSPCRWFIVKKAKIFWSYVKHFWIFTGVRKCKILIGLWK